jgi:hypothetical protein
MYILTHPEYEVGLRERFEAILASMLTDEDRPPAFRVETERMISILPHPLYAKERNRRLLERNR